MPAGTSVVAFLLGTAVFVVVPGPSTFVIIGRAVALGRRAAIATAAGNLAGVLVIVGAVSVGVGALVERFAVALLVLKVAGAVYLIRLGIQAWRHRGELGALSVPDRTGDRRAVREGFVVGVTNPKAIVFFTAVLPQFVDPARAPVTGQMLVLGVLFCALASTVDALWALGAGTARDWFARSPRRLRVVGGAGGLTLVGTGVTLLLSGPDGRGHGSGPR